MNKKPNQTIHFEEALERMRQYCSYRDRSHREVRTKLIEMKVYGDKLEQVMARLVEEDFLNEERFARAFARGKFRINKWGREKIKQSLKIKGVSAYCIRKGMQEIDDDEYISTLKDLLEKKIKSVKDKNKAHRFQKLNKFALQKGYEYGLVKKIIDELLN